MLAELGLPISGAAVARRYAGLIDGFVLDEADPLPDPRPLPRSDRPPDNAAQMRFARAATLMVTPEDRLRLAREVLRIADDLPRGARRA